jgi:phosphohistidine phosphatase
MARVVYLIRHAVAFDRDRKRWSDDRQRPLTPEGMRKFRKAAAGLELLIGPIDRLLVSPLVRTRQTADILQEVIGWPQPIDAPDLAPGRTPAQALALMRKHDVESLALVGHEPNLSELIAVSVAGAGARVSLALKKGGAACITFAAPPRPGQGQLEWLLVPKALRALGR